MPRDQKINHEILQIFNNLIKERNLLLACTDEDLVILLNDQLFVEHRISYRTFQRYKRRALQEMDIPDADPLYLDLFCILRTAYARLKQQLLTAIMEDRQGASRYQWILERKFREWNMRWHPATETLAPEADEENPAEPIPEAEEQYPTLIGPYHDLDNPYRPQDIMPVHYAVFNGYVIPNPDYDGDPDDNTRQIERMWNLKIACSTPPPSQPMDTNTVTQQQNLKPNTEPETTDTPEPTGEQAEKPATTATHTTDSHERQKAIVEQMRLERRLRAKINAKGSRQGFYEEGQGDDMYVPYEVD